MAKKYIAYLANLDIEVPVFSVDPNKGQMTIKVCDIPKNIAKSAHIDKQEFVTYWYDPNAGGNRLIAQDTETSQFNAQEIVDAILVVAKGFRALSESRLKRETIVALIHTQSKIAKRDIEIVLNNLDTLESDWLKSEK